MSRALRRPVWHYMGWWKWPSMALLLFCGIAIYLYFDLAPGGAARWGAHSFDGHLAGCPVRLGVTRRASELDAHVWIDPACAWRLATPRLAIESGGQPLRETDSLAGLPNPDRLTLLLPERPKAQAGLALVLDAATQEGKRAHLRWALPPPHAKSPS